MKITIYSRYENHLKKYVLVIIIACFIVSCSAQKNKIINTQQKPNIIFIMSDDHAYHAISAYDKSLIQTPYIDQIAKEGALFKKAYVTNSLCGPSRAVILTGKYSHINGFRDNQDTFDGSQQTLPKILKSNGYTTGIVGKWHLKTDPQGFDYWNILHGQGDYYKPGFSKLGKDTLYKGYVTDITTDLALNWINANKEKPFFLMIHQKAPHRNQMPPLDNLNLFNDRTFEMPSTFYDDYKNRLALQQNKTSMINDLDIDQDNKVPCDTCGNNKTDKFNPNAYKREIKRLSPEEKAIWDKAYQKVYAQYASIKNKDELIRWQFQRYMQDYLRTVKSVDDNVGRVLKYLKNNNLEENTIIIYTSDQGVFLGEHGLYDKRFMYEESFRTPMMIRYPKGIKKGQELDEMVMNLDIAPTLLSYAGITPPNDMQGMSMKKILSDKSSSTTWRDKIYYHYYEDAYGITPHYGIRTDRYKLIHFYGKLNTWELYDLQSDPQEMKNIYDDKTYANLLENLKKDLKDLQLRYKDTSN
ncbi:hypothetical protein A5893_05140 [Pedobacter psychrophilus]|uniref:N-sulphoglucosamine sulphohydrolase C-terminal domain-containing protein n=1 Tax=Pedobacter psychrophilus TaxID=1826909 RepID=A0A179DIF7_9SPHI|nr:sulfatase [Pedobacter psychrophilus]OAQ40339.1 hypothetical protein A5893_05140 [Pedobacter psychrophilus]